MPNTPSMHPASPPKPTAYRPRPAAWPQKPRRRARSGQHPCSRLGHPLGLPYSNAGDDAGETEGGPQAAEPQIAIRTDAVDNTTITAPEQIAGTLDTLDKVDTERNRHFRLTLTALEQAQESFLAARIADNPGPPRETAESCSVKVAG